MAWETCQDAGGKRLTCTDGDSKGLGEYPCCKIWDTDIMLIEAAKHKRKKWVGRKISLYRDPADSAHGRNHASTVSQELVDLLNNWGSLVRVLA